jgi:hypothetical protein
VNKSQAGEGKRREEGEREREKKNQWEFKGPKMEVPYHIRPYVWGISPYMGLT